MIRRPALPSLTGENSNEDRLVRSFAAAVTNLGVINSVPGRDAGEPPLYLRAGGGYDEPWTRDAAINAWLGASLICPAIARDTLRMVCDTLDNGTLLIAQDDQWWDQMLWVVAARRHVLATGDSAFLAEAFDIGVRSMEIAHEERFEPRWGLYRGPAVMQDGISGYPSSPCRSRAEHRLLRS